ncbi:hypothetical protein ICL81_07955 [Leucobacter sp. cx-328]|uniref:hypothetical protein n=1 Tax=unclassified Leucobacter TaxID=2621730 RepID=UPI00165E5401|nr:MULTISPECIES: hypothetical protein [unclassified Leucobacter]MBC9944441.1 hypothetical protein [Leucobacter sp. cx-328]
MSSTTKRRLPDDDGWWSVLGLRAVADRVMGGLAERVLREHPPIAFVSVVGGAPLSLEQVAAMIEAAAQEREQRRELAAIERREADLAEFEGAFDQPNAGDVVERGRWSGITRGEATAWCWNLFQYEPHGFVHPGSQVREEALATLRSGGLPEVFGYPERARELIEKGMTARCYRQLREELGSPMFDPAGVRRG